MLHNFREPQILLISPSHQTFHNFQLLYKTLILSKTMLTVKLVSVNPYLKEIELIVIKDAVIVQVGHFKDSS